MNTTPNLVIALALAWAEKHAPDLNASDRKYAELRVYPADRTTGYFFVPAKAPARWYWKDEPGAEFYSRASVDDLLADVAGGARVQLIGDHGRSLALWKSWTDCVACVACD
jgi:hypothetical protein